MSMPSDSKQDSASTEPPVTLDEQAIQAATQLQRQEAAYRTKALRLYIDGKGCDGFVYGVTFDDRDERDIAWLAGSITVVIDPDTLEFLNGARVTFVDDERGRGFLVENPRHRDYRGKFYKRRDWREKLEARRQT